MHTYIFAGIAMPTADALLTVYRDTRSQNYETTQRLDDVVVGPMLYRIQ